MQHELRSPNVGCNIRAQDQLGDPLRRRDSTATKVDRTVDERFLIHRISSVGH